MSRALVVTVVLLAACGGAPTTGSRAAVAAPLAWTVLESPTTESLRGLSVVSPDVVWASGAHGTTLRTIDGGRTWSSTVVPGAEALDLRSLHAFDAARAIVLSAGAPARAFLTTDGGATFVETYTRDVPGIFFDALAFWDEREGIAIGDPLEGTSGPRYSVLVTHDGGEHWEEREGPPAEAGEAAFAASNGVIALPAPGRVRFGSGGAASHVFASEDGGATWTRADSAMASGGSAGVFAIAFEGERGFAVGGDYASPIAPGSFARTIDGGATWSAGPALAGYRSSIAVSPGALLVVGTSGSELSRDEGASWTAIGTEALNTVRIAGGVAYAVGPGGAIARL